MRKEHGFIGVNSETVGEEKRTFYYSRYEGRNPSVIEGLSGVASIEELTKRIESNETTVIKYFLQRKTFTAATAAMVLWRLAHGKSVKY